MRTLAQINIRNRPYYFCNNMTNIKNDIPSFKRTDSVIYGINYITIKGLGKESSMYILKKAMKINA